MPNYVQYSTSNLTGSLRKGNVALGVTTSSIAGPTSTSNWYTGITPDSGKYVIYKTAASGDPDIFCPQTDTELYNFVIMQGGSTSNTTSVSASLSWIATQTNLLAVNFDYENIVTDGLVFNVDAGLVGSYPQTSSTWYDTSGNSRNVLLINTPTYSSSNSGSLTFSTASLQYATASNIGSLTTWTAEVWFKLTSSLTGKITSVISNEFDLVNKLNFSIGTNNQPTNANLAVGFFDGAWRTTAGFVPSVNTWYQVVGTYDGSIIRQYVNGTASGGTLTYTGTPQSGGTIRLMRRWDSPVLAGNLCDGDLTIARLYNKALTSTEVLQNYNAQRGRFGI
jgi:hypothetical protein